MKNKKALLLLCLLLISILSVSASSELHGVSRVSMGVGVPTPVSFSTFIDSDLVRFSQSVSAVPTFDASLYFQLPNDHYIGASAGLNIFPIQNGEYISAISLLTDYAIRLDVDEYVIPLEAGLGFAMFKKDNCASFGMALSLRTGLEYEITDNFFLGLDASITQFVEFGLYLNYAIFTYQMVTEPRVVAGVRW